MMNLNIQQVIDDFIIERNGVYPRLVPSDKIVLMPVHYITIELSKFRFEARAKELGFVGKYRWGVEYATEGKKPDLDSEVIVECRLIDERLGDNRKPNRVSWWDWSKMGIDSDIKSFKITDERYKPQDTSYLQQNEEKVKLVNPAQELLNSLSDMTDEELSIIGNTPEAQQLVEVLKSQEHEKNIQKQALALYRSVNYNCELQDSVIIFSKRFDDYVKAIKDGWTHPNVTV